MITGILMCFNECHYKIDLTVFISARAATCLDAISDNCKMLGVKINIDWDVEAFENLLPQAWSGIKHNVGTY